MKKSLLLLALLCETMLMAQNKSVAVTEVVDKEDRVSYAVEVMVRTRLTAAISMKQGYTAYDRVDLQSIMAEQDFQRTGLVDNATIKRLGEMSGASLIMIPEVALSDDGNIFVAVKMLDVETTQTMMSTGQLMGSSSTAVEEGCNLLVSKVLGGNSVAVNTNIPVDEPVTLFGYLHVFPMDIGEFQILPEQLLSAINKQAQFGYDSWRLPTEEELSILRTNSNLIPNLKNTDYLYSGSSKKGFVRLVTTEPSVAIKKSARRKAIFGILGLDDNGIYRIIDNYITYTLITDKCNPEPLNGFELVKDKGFLQTNGTFSKPYCIGFRADSYTSMDSNGHVRSGAYATLMYSDGTLSSSYIGVTAYIDGRGVRFDQEFAYMFRMALPPEYRITEEMQKYY